jgi:hypothetical protein
MSLTELILIVGLWAIWMGLLLVVLHGLGRDGRQPRRPMGGPARRAGQPHLS